MKTCKNRNLQYSYSCYKMMRLGDVLYLLNLKFKDAHNGGSDIMLYFYLFMQFLITWE